MIDTMLAVLFENLIILGGMFMVAIIITLIAWFTDRGKGVVDRIVSWFKRKPKDTIEEYAGTFTKIHHEILELRVRLNASRSYVMQFHNGEYFNLHTSRWKLTQTYETCEDGVSYEGKHIHNFDVTLLWDIFQVIFVDSADSVLDGVTRINSEVACNGSTCGQTLKSVYLIDVSKLSGQSGYSKTLFINRGTKYALMTPIMDSRGNILGAIFVDYIYDIRTLENLNYCLMCAVASNIAMAWELNSDLKMASIRSSEVIFKKDHNINQG